MMEVICKGRVRFDVDRLRVYVEPEGKGADELQPGMRVWIVMDAELDAAPIPYRVTEAGLAAVAA